MFTDQDLQELLNFQASHPVVSLYLNTDPAQGNAEMHKLRLRSMLKEVHLPEDEQAILRYFDHQHDWLGRSVAVFSCAPEGFWKTFSLAVPVRSRVRLGEQPHVKPLADLLDSYGGYGVALVDKQGARLFLFHLGQLQEQEGMVGELVRHTKRGGGSQSAGRRGGTAGQTDYEEEVAERNIREAVEFATRFFAEKKVRRVLIGGTEENIAIFRSHLPKAWQSLVMGTFSISMTAGYPEVLEKSIQLGLQVEREREITLAQSLVTGTAKGRSAVLHLEDTLKAIHEGRVMTLLVREGFRAPGSRCAACGYISSLPMDSCPFCGGNVRPIPDVVELAVSQVMRQGGEVEVLDHEQEVKGFEQIGARLRY